jgi:hypothetical protein
MDSELKRELDEVKSYLKLLLLSQGGSMPVTAIGPTFTGETIGTTNRYVILAKNNFDRLVAARVTARFSIPGQTASLSLTSDLSNQGRIDILSSSGKVISEQLWLKPNQTLWINTADTAFSLNGAEFKVLLFDPLAFLPVFGGGVT